MRKSFPAVALIITTFFAGRCIAAEKPDQAALDTLGWRFGGQAYTFRAMSLFETLDVLHGLGIRCVELYPGQRLSPDDPKLRVGPELTPERIESHLKDLNAAKEDVPWGTGECDVRGMLAELKRQGKPVTILIEYESSTGQQLIDNVGKCVEQFNKVARELAKAQ